MSGNVIFGGYVSGRAYTNKNTRERDTKVVNT